ncbi:sensor histidine kinase [Pedobacter sp. Hv1]|uniref:sensor histidine kinase n=1 Tax=Pedobacter sp. Hv1 TaxID=1740090 RepID=UPI0006D89BA0|nr:histidine kinase [Pedobacter sp. Hv1]KQC01555.1 hypothetical protein AQF98_07565 [Pedobacter sp. Hv1]
MDRETIAKLRFRFWPFQVAFWFIIGGINFVAQYFVAGFTFKLAVLNLVGLALGGFMATWWYRSYLKRKKIDFRFGGPSLIRSILGAALLQSLLWMFLMLLLSWPFAKQFSISFIQVLVNLVPLYIITLVWNLLYVGYHLIRKFHTYEVEKWKLESEFQKAQLGTLKAQVNPHFMFNAINNIRALILENPILAREMLTKFAEVFRYSLQYSNEKLITIKDELEILINYLEIHKLQFEEKLKYSINIDDSLQTETIPPMMLQLLVENSIKHGIGMSQKGGEIIIDVFKTDDTLHLSVKNTGSLQKHVHLEDNLGIGLQNVSERLMLTYGGDAKLEIREEFPFVVVNVSIKK